MRIIRSVFLLGCMALVSGCATLDFVSLGASGISYLVSGKSLSDHVMSAIKNEDCAMHRALNGEKTCIALAAPNEMMARIETKEPFTIAPVQMNVPVHNNDFTQGQIVVINTKNSDGNAVTGELPNN